MHTRADQQVVFRQLALYVGGGDVLRLFDGDLDAVKTQRANCANSCVLRSVNGDVKRRC